MGSFKVAIVGAGQLGGLLAHRIPGSYRKVIISRRKAHAVSLADEVGGIASDQVSAVRGCEVVFLTLPGSAITGMIQELAPHLGDQALLVNMATDIMTDELAATYPRLRFAAAKLLGHAQEISMGSPGIVILDYVEGVNQERLRHLLSGLGDVVVDQEVKVLTANATVVEILAKAEEDLRTRLGELGLDQPLVKAAIATTGPGVLRSLANGIAGPFARGMIERLRAGEPVNKGTTQ